MLCLGPLHPFSLIKYLPNRVVRKRREEASQSDNCVHDMPYAHITRKSSSLVLSRPAAFRTESITCIYI